MDDQDRRKNTQPDEPLRVRRTDDGIIDTPQELRESLEAHSRDRADGRFDSMEDYRGERRLMQQHSEAYELMSISPEADHIHDWGLFQFIACIVVAIAVIVYFSIGQREVYFEGMSPWFFDWMGFFRGFILALLLVLASNTVRVWSNSLSIIVEANFRGILNDEEKQMETELLAAPTPAAEAGLTRSDLDMKD